MYYNRIKNTIIQGDQTEINNLTAMMGEYPNKEYAVVGYRDENNEYDYRSI